MELKELKQRNTEHDKQLVIAYEQFNKMLTALQKEDITQEIVIFINTKVEAINSMKNSDNELKKELKKAQGCILNKVEKELKLVPKHYYRSTWLALGMAAFGIPLGLIFGVSLGNMGFLGIGLPIGMVIGLSVGTAMDKKAFEEGRQLDLELR
ncbi:hypothetical protein [Polaribacter sp. Hel_I_88]|uniref:hypothetical protein n=1 Tax=Polaribacter sp. Hel_I_88 TaxID=1250006 RepID=UPI000478B2CA|nr:hypothetical protein [Polaribacter sp. Hel_I_88]